MADYVTEGMTKKRSGGDSVGQYDTTGQPWDYSKGMNTTGPGQSPQAPQSQSPYTLPMQRNTNLPQSYQRNEPLPQWNGQRPTDNQGRTSVPAGAVPMHSGQPGWYGGNVSWFDPATGRTTDEFGHVKDTTLTGADPATWQALAALAQGNPGGMLSTEDFANALKTSSGPMAGGGTAVVGGPEDLARRAKNAAGQARMPAGSFDREAQRRFDQTSRTLGSAYGPADWSRFLADPRAVEWAQRTGKTIPGMTPTTPTGTPGPGGMNVSPASQRSSMQVGSTLTPQDAAWWPDGVLPDFVTPRTATQPTAGQPMAAPSPTAGQQTQQAMAAPTTTQTSMSNLQPAATPAINPQMMMQLFQALLSQGQGSGTPGGTGTMGSTLDPAMLQQLIASLGMVR